MDLSIPKDAPDVSEDAPPEEGTSESFPNQEKDSETAAPVTADPLANLKADFESQKAVFESRETFDSSPADVDMKPAGKKNPPALSTAVESSEDITPLHSAATAAGGDDRKSALATAKDRKEARKMRRKNGQNADVDKKLAGEVDRLELAPAVESSEDFSPLHNSASRPFPRPPSARPGAVYVGATEINNSEWTLQTQEEPDMEQGLETMIIPIAAEVVLGEVVLPDHESESNEAISEAQIVKTAETAKLCGQPRWLIFAMLGVLVSVAIGAGLAIALSIDDTLAQSDSPSPTSTPTSALTSAPTPDRRNEVEKIISAEIPSFQLGPSQEEALNWLAHHDPANLDFERVSPDEVLERFVIALLYFSTGSENLYDPAAVLLRSSVCDWERVVCNQTVVESSPIVVQVIFEDNNLGGRLPTELGLLTGLQSLELGKFATVYRSELDTIILLGSLSYNLSPLRFCRV
jgi:hypothetical protein